MSLPLKHILKNTGYLVGARSMNMIVRGVYAITLARFLGPEQYGLYNYALGWYLAFIPFTSLGLWAVISRDMGKSETRGRQTISQTLALRSILSLLTAIACAVTGWLMHSDETTRQLLIIFSVAMVGRALANWVEHVFNACSSSKFVFKLEAIFRPVEALTSIVILFLGGGLLQLAIVHGLIWWCQGMVGMSMLQQNLFNVRPEWQMAGIHRLLRKGVLLGLSAFMIIWFFQGPLLLARHTGFTFFELGQLALLLQIFTILSAIPAMLGNAALPILSKSEQQINDKDKKILLISLKFILFIGILAGLFGWFIGHWIIKLLFGGQFEMSSYYLGIILSLLIPWSWGNMLQLRLLSRGLLRMPTLTLLAGVTIFTFTFFQATIYLGFTGIFIALGVGLWVWVISIYLIQQLPIALLVKSILFSLITLSIILFIDNTIQLFLISLMVILLGFWFVIISAVEREYIYSKLVRD